MNIGSITIVVASASSILRNTKEQEDVTFDDTMLSKIAREDLFAQRTVTPCLRVRRPF